MNIYVGNLAQEVSEDDLREAFGAFGEITSVKIIKDKFSGETRGFGFIEMPARQAAKTAMESMDGQELKGKKIIVNEARARTDNRRSGGSGGSGGGGGRRRSSGWQSRY
jgi:RNA recognition motif-containing protein